MLKYSSCSTKSLGGKKATPATGTAPSGLAFAAPYSASNPPQDPPHMPIVPYQPVPNPSRKRNPAVHVIDVILKIASGVKPAEDM